MPVSASTGLRNAVLTSGSLKSIMEASNGMELLLYGGTPPADANAAIGSATLLCRITDNDTGAGLEFESAAIGGVLTKDESQVWSGEVLASGTAAFYRLVADGDDGEASTTQPRLQGSVGIAGADLNLSSVSLVESALQPINFFNVVLPTF